MTKQQVKRGIVTIAVNILKKPRIKTLT